MTIARALVAVFLVGLARGAASAQAERAPSEAELAAVAALESASRGMQRPATRALGQARAAWLRVRLGARPEPTRALCRDALILAERRSPSVRTQVEARVAATRARLGDKGAQAALLAALAHLDPVTEPAPAEEALAAWLEAAADAGATDRAWQAFSLQAKKRPHELQCRLLAAGVEDLIRLGWEAPARAWSSALLGDSRAYRAQLSPERLAALRELFVATDRLFARWLPDPHRERIWAAFRLRPAQGETWLPALRAALRGVPRAWERSLAEARRLQTRSPYLALVARAAGVLNAAEAKDLRGTAWLRDTLAAVRKHAEGEAPLERRLERALLLWKLYPSAIRLLARKEAVELLRGEFTWAFEADRDPNCLALISLGLTEALGSFPAQDADASLLLEGLYEWANLRLGQAERRKSSPLAFCAVFGDVARAERALFGTWPMFGRPRPPAVRGRSGSSLTQMIREQLGATPIERWPEPQRLLPCRALVECVSDLGDAEALLSKLEPLHADDRAEVQVLLLEHAGRLEPKVVRAGVVVRTLAQSGLRLTPARWLAFQRAAERALLAE